jgi:uncharacterized protein YbcC (UPF0753/DUF2309 family)
MTLDERLSEIEHRPTTWTIDDCEDVLALAREYRDELAEAVRLLKYAKRVREAERWSEVEPEWDAMVEAQDAFIARHEGEKHE